MTTRKLFLHFARCETEKPIVYHLVKDYQLVINIFRAKVTPEEEGYLVLDVTGEEADIERAIEFVKTFDVKVDPVNKGLRWDPEICTHCGNCVPHCPTAALHIPNRTDMRISFSEELCVECLACIKNCPYNACVAAF